MPFFVDQQQGNLEVTDPSKDFFNSRSVTSRSQSVVEEGKIENGLDNVSDLYSDSNLTICQDLDSKTSDGFGKMLGNSDFESAFASVNVSSVTDDLFLLQDNTFSCSKCSFTTDRKSRLNDHERNHRKNNLPIFSCTYCNQKYTRYMLYLHVQNVHPGQTFQIRDEGTDEVSSKPLQNCTGCSFSSDNPTKFKLHLQTHAVTTSELGIGNRQIRSCELCSYSTIYPSCIKEHMITHMNNPPMKQCLMCNYKSTPQALVFHIAKCPKKSGSVDSSVKSKGTRAQPKGSHGIKKAKLKLHNGTDPFEPVQRTDESGRLFFDCRLCSYGTSRFTDMVGHVNSHRKNVPILKCPGCDFKSTPRALFFHKRKCQTGSVKSTSGPNEVEIEQESQDAVNTEPKAEFKLHMPTHAITTSERGQRFYSCELCSYSTINSHKIKGHMTSHLNNRPIKQCLMCSYKSTPQALAYHVANCPKKSASKGNVDSSVEGTRAKPKETHGIKKAKLKLHSRADPFEPVPRTDESGRLFFDCRLCSYGTSRFTDMVGHVNSHRKNAPILKCPSCDFKSTARALLFHKRKCQTGSAKGLYEPNEVEVKESVDSSAAKSKGAIAKPQTTHRIKKAKLKLRSRTDRFVQRSDESGRLFFDCRLCSFVGSCFTKMVRHVNSHRKNVPILKCSDCDFKSTPHALLFHKRKCQTGSAKGLYEPNEVEVKGSVDSSAAKSKGAIAKPQRTHRMKAKLKLHSRTDRFVQRTDESGRGFFDCRLCSYGASRIDNMVDHDSSHRKNVPILKCPGCDFKSTPRALFFHKRKCQTGSAKGLYEPNEVEVKGSVDSSAAKSKGAIAMLQRTHEISRTDPFEPVQRTDESGRIFFDCRLCSYVGSQFTKMVYHVNSHRKNVPILKCPGCDFKSTPRALFFHKRKCQTGSAKGFYEPNEVEVKESVDSSAAKSKGAIAMPQRTHGISRTDLFEPVQRTDESGRLFFDCRLCSYVGSRFTKMVLHVNSHRNNVPILKCPGCDFKSTPRAVLFHKRKCQTGSAKGLNEPNEVEVKGSVNSSAGKSKGAIAKPQTTHKIKKTKLKLHYRTDLFVQRTDNFGRLFFDCRLCSYVASRFSHMVNHVNSHRKNVPILKCSGCDFKSTPHALYCHKQKCQTGSAKSTSGPNEIEIKGNVDSSAAKSKGATAKPQMIHRIKKAKLKFRSRSDRFVKRTDDSGRQFFDCRLCSYGTSYFTDMVGHVNTHRKNVPILKCSGCDFKSTSRVLLFHKRKCLTGSAKGTSGLNEIDMEQKGRGAVNTEPKAVFKCTQCSFVTFLRIKLKLHIRKRHLKPRNVAPEVSAPILNCLRCSFSTLSPAELELHQEKCSAATENGFKCNLCSVVTKLKHHWEDHMKSHARHLPILKCPGCSFKSIAKLLRKHMDSSGHRKAVIGPPVKSSSSYEVVYKCKLCSFTSSDRDTYMNHKSKHNSINGFKCKLCSLVCSHATYLKYHMNSHRLKRPLKKCTKCNFKSTPLALVRHIRDSKHYTNCSSKKIDPNKMPDSATKSTFKCSLCPFSSSLRIKLNSHVKKYHNQIKKEHGRKSGKLFQCNYCSYAASIKNNIEKHLNTHFKWKMPVQKCQNCDYRSTATALKIHFKDCQKNQAAKNSENNEHVPQNKLKPLSKNLERVAIVEANEAGSECVSESSQADYHQPPIPGDSMGSPEMFACTLCSYTTRRKEDLQKHLLFHQKNPEIQQCPCCSYKATPMALVFHMKCENHSNEMAENEKKRKRVTERVGRTPYICQYCSFTSFVPYAMERHMNSHTLLKLPVKQCEKCPFRSTPAALSAHRKGCTGKVGSPSKKFRHIDSGVYNSKDKANTLLDTPKIQAKAPHVKSLLKECQISPTKNVLEEESCGMTSVNTSASDGSPKTVFNCPKCSFATSLRIKLKFHVQKNHLVSKARAVVRSLGSNKRFKKCTYCSYIGKSSDMDKHEETHTIRKWPIKKCPKCAFRSTQLALKRHMIRCSGRSQ